MLSRPADYEEEATTFGRIFAEAMPGAKTMLELGSGGGNNASFLKHSYAMTLVDRAPGMLAVSRRLNTDLPHYEGDMRTVRLGHQFDLVFIHDAVCYMISEDDLSQAMQTAFAHLRPGGFALFVPDFVRETFQPETSSGGHDGADVTPPMPGHALRYLEWTYDPDPSDSTYVSDFAYLLREGEQEVRCIYDRHINGLFSIETWLRLLRGAGFIPQALPFTHSEVSGSRHVFLAQRPT